MVTDPAKRTADDQKFLDTLQVDCPDITTTLALTETFTNLVRLRDVPRLDLWLAQAQHNGVLRELREFARGLHDDPAVRAALMLPWSNEQVEGQINKLELIKRQMCGRAGFELLRQRVLYR